MNTITQQHCPQCKSTAIKTRFFRKDTQKMRVVCGECGRRYQETYSDTIPTNDDAIRKAKTILKRAYEAIKLEQQRQNTDIDFTVQHS